MKIAIFASGGGSNAQKIINYFRHHPKIGVALIVSNNTNAGVIDLAQKEDIPFYILQDGELEEEEFSEVLVALNIDFIVLAGFLKKIPNDIIKAYPNKIVNIHPALLPKYGGKGMYGMNVHKAVVESGEKESGMTIHYVNENYDEGSIIEQHKVELSFSDTPEDCAKKVLSLEHKFFAPCIERLLTE
ncbi:MAG TPA: phosphoribosylglycinamide formyltransferase [Crocinitomix sp.]|nr:phosphoribosylglycinamide formyltransferase [Crocinitomix sp.]